MNAAVVEAKSALRRIAQQADEILADKSLSAEQKQANLNRLNSELEAHTKTIATWYQAGNALMLGADSGRGGGLSLASKGLGSAPGLVPSEDQLHELHEAVLARKSFRVQVKDTSNVSSSLPPTLVPGIVPMAHEPRRVLDFIPSKGISTPTWEYFRHASTTGAAGTVAPGGLKPSVDLVIDTLTGKVSKIAVTTTVEDESLADFSGFAGYVVNELTRIYIDEENAQLLNGDGTGTNMLGLLQDTDILARDHATDVAADATLTGLDTLEQSITDLRVGQAFATAEVVVLHPTTWSKLRRTKDSQGRYIVNPDPTAGEANKLWGLPVLTTTSIGTGVAVVAQLSIAAEARIRQGITIDTDASGDNFVHNKTTFRVEGRTGMAVPKPKAIIKVTNLPT